MGVAQQQVAVVAQPPAKFAGRVVVVPKQAPLIPPTYSTFAVRRRDVSLPHAGQDPGAVFPIIFAGIASRFVAVLPLPRELRTRVFIGHAVKIGLTRRSVKPKLVPVGAYATPPPRAAGSDAAPSHTGVGSRVQSMCGNGAIAARRSHKPKTARCESGSRLH